MSPRDPAAALLALFRDIDPALYDEAAFAALESYLSLLMRWSVRINLTGFRTPESAAEGLLYDAVEIAPHLPARAVVLDVGAGAGGLGTTLAVLRPDVSVRFVEPRTKRAAFLRAVVRTLDLRERVSVVGARAEQLPAEAAGADVAIAQAVFPPREWLALAPSLVAPTGRVLCLSSRPLGPEVAIPERLEVESIRTYRLPFSGAERTVTILRAISPGQ